MESILHDVSMVEAPAPRGYTYLGCFVDSADRDLSGPTPGVATNPLDAAAACSVACSGFQYFGLHWENQCFCGASYGGQGKDEDGAGCDADGVITDGVAYLCGNDEADCGWRNAVYEIGGPTEPQLAIGRPFVVGAGAGRRHLQAAAVHAPAGSNWAAEL